MSGGPGATNASSGLHVAHQGGTPLVMFIGQVGRDSYGRQDFQELDYYRVFGSMAKLVVQVERADRVQELINRAFEVASSGRPGPVVVSLAEDMLVDEAAPAPIAPYKPVRTAPDLDLVEGVLALLAAARRPIIVVGSSTWAPATAGKKPRTARRPSAAALTLAKAPRAASSCS